MEDFIRRWPITPLQKGILSESFFLSNQVWFCDARFLAAVLELGALFGALSAGLLADRYSRRHSIIVACGTFWCSLLARRLSSTFFSSQPLLLFNSLA